MISSGLKYLNKILFNVNVWEALIIIKILNKKIKFIFYVKVKDSFYLQNLFVISIIAFIRFLKYFKDELTLNKNSKVLSDKYIRNNNKRINYK
jgi:hypothetical protein